MVSEGGCGVDVDPQTSWIHAMPHRIRVTEYDETDGFT